MRIPYTFSFTLVLSLLGRFRVPLYPLSLHKPSMMGSITTPSSLVLHSMSVVVSSNESLSIVGSMSFIGCTSY